MEALLEALAQSGIAQYLRFSRWGYAAVNTVHVFSIALLVGCTLTMDLKLFGAWPRIAHDALARVLLPVAFCGLLIALITGPLLFLTRPTEYIALGIFQFKLVLIVIGALSAMATHLVYGLWLEQAERPARLRTGAISLICWLGALVAGRMIAFAGS
ncbi:MAG: hypothetical protein ACFHHU_10700 [Porticoccaceae bacterium]